LSKNIGTSGKPPPFLPRPLGFWQALSLNTTNMVGIGPFITIPLFLSAVGEPSALWGWVIGALLAVSDGFVWSELAAAQPYSGGTYHYLRALSGPVWGPRLAFLFLWQLAISGPLEIASGCLGLAQYASYLLPVQAAILQKTIGVLTVLTALWFLSRDVKSVGRIAVVLAYVMMALCVFVAGSGLWLGTKPLVEILAPLKHVNFSFAWTIGLGHATVIAIYDYMGYYNICYAAEEVSRPEKTIPRSILWSLALIGILYFSMNLAVLKVLPWKDASSSKFVISLFFERLYGTAFSQKVTWFILLTAFASVFALLAAYARILYAASRAGDFFSLFAELHPVQKDPRKALWLVGAISMLACFIDLPDLITACVTLRIVIQFLAQIWLVMRQRKAAADLPYRMPLYPVPLILAGAGWTYLFLTSGMKILVIASGITLAGLLISIYRTQGSLNK
jgi:amino acid transporter